MQNSIQIQLQINDEAVYTMLYPETVRIQLQLSRSEQWWGVFLNIVETFQAIKQDRLYLLDAFNQWEGQGWSDDFKIKIIVSVSEFGVYNSIYTGFAMPEYNDDTYYFKTKFNESGEVSDFLEGTIERNLQYSEDGSQYYFPDRTTIDRIYSIITGSTLNSFNTLNYKLSDSLRTVDFGGGNNGSVLTSSFLSSNNTPRNNFLANKKNPDFQNILFLDNQIKVPKQANITIQLSDFGGFVIPYAKDGSNYRGASSFSVSLFFEDAQTANDTFTYTLTDLFNSYYYQLNKNTATATNNTNNTAILTLNTEIAGLDNFDNINFSYSSILLGNPAQNNFSFSYSSNINTIGNYTIGSILNDLFEFDIQLQPLRNTFNGYAIFPDDGVIAQTTSRVLAININEFLTQIKNATGIGVSFNPQSNKLKLQPIFEMFSDNQIEVIQESDIFVLSKSINNFLKINNLKLGAEDRKFKYQNSNSDQNKLATYTARNVFSGSLDLSLNAYKCQALDFVDQYRDDTFSLNEEDKNDGNFVLYHRSPTNSLTGRFYHINAAHTPVSQVAAWSWLLRLISPNGFDLSSEANQTEVKSPVSSNTISLTDDINPSNQAFNELPLKITMYKINAKIRLTTSLYNRIVNNRDGYLTLIYKGVTYKGYINNLVLDIGKNMIAELELLEKFEQ